MLNLINALDETIVAARTWGTKPRVRHYPSSALDCQRKLFYAWKGTPGTNPPDATGHIKMAIGDLIHDMTMGYFKQSGKIMKLQEEVANRKTIPGLKYPISYRVDGIGYEDGNKIGIEIKSSHGRSISDMKKNGPKDTHLAQCCVYMWLEEMDHLYLIGIARDSAYRTQSILTFNDAGEICADGRVYPKITFAQLVQDWKDLETALEFDAIPQRGFMVAIANGEIKDQYQKDKVIYKTDWHCTYCNYQKMCWKDALRQHSSSKNVGMFGDN